MKSAVKFNNSQRKTFLFINVVLCNSVLTRSVNKLWPSRIAWLADLVEGDGDNDYQRRVFGRGDYHNNMFRV